MIRNFDIPQCPDCNGSMSVRDSRKRLVKDIEGNIYTFHLRRLCCNSCGHIHIELPDFIMGYKQYSKTTIEKVVSGESDTFAGDNRTISRWKNKK